MTPTLTSRSATAAARIPRNLGPPAVCLVLLLCPVACLRSAENRERNNQRGEVTAGPACKVLADRRLEEPLRAIIREYLRREGAQVTVEFLPAADVGALVEKKRADYDVVLCMPPGAGRKTPVASLARAKTVAWKHPSFEPVWAAALSDHPEAIRLIRFLGGPTGHRLWSESEAGFTIVSGTSAKAYEWVAEHRTKHTYPMTAMRMLAECGAVRKGICIDVGCGPGHLDVELAKRADFTIIGLDIDPQMRPLFEKRIREAGLEDRVSFVLGDAQKMPFPDDYADLIVSRGALIFIPDIKKCLKEVDRVLKPTGVAFLGGRYVYTPQAYKISTRKLREIVRESGIPGAQVIDARGQWVKIVGPKAPEAARRFQGGPQMLAGRLVADYGITEGKCLLICSSDGALQQALQQGLMEMTDLEITAMYPSEEVMGEARKRIREAKLAGRITCKVGTIDALPFDEASFDLIAGVGPVLIFQKDKPKAIREIYRTLRPGGVALVGGRYLGMPDGRKVSSQSLREAAAKTGVPSIRVIDDMGQWVEIRRGIKDRGLRD